jgi:2-hydroxy-6-oxonona-2,4-dienedioate hydrolase
MSDKPKVVSREVLLSHGRTRYLESGSGHPMILLHGSDIAAGADEWRLAMDTLSPNFRVIAPDFVGWPPGDTRHNMNAFPNFTDFVREFQDGLGLRSSYIVGAAMGGWVAGLLAYESPNRVNAVVMTGNAGFTGSGGGQPVNFKAPSMDSIRQTIDRIAGMMSESEREALAEEKSRMLNQPGYVQAHAEMMNTRSDRLKRLESNLIRRLPFLRMPTLFLFGRDDAFGGSDVIENLQRLTVHSQTAIIEEGGHQLHIDNTQTFCENVSRFLGKT